LGGAQDLIVTDVTTLGDVAPIAKEMSDPILSSDRPMRRAVERAELEIGVTTSVVMAQLVGSKAPTPLDDILVSELPASATQKETLDKVAPMMLLLVNALDQLCGVVLEVDNIWRRRGVAHWADPRLYPLSVNDHIDDHNWDMPLGQTSNRLRGEVNDLRRDLNELRIGENYLGCDATPVNFYSVFRDMKITNSYVLQLTERHYKLEEEEWQR